MLAAIGFVFCAGHACADAESGPIFDAEALAFCLQDEAHPAICIGSGARECWQDDPSTMTVGLCYAREFEFWEAARDLLEQELAVQDQRIDTDLAELRGEAVAQGAHADVIAAWPAYREARCGYVSARFGPGSGEGPAWMECRMQVTAEHVIWLQGLAVEE